MLCHTFSPTTLSIFWKERISLLLRCLTSKSTTKCGRENFMNSFITKCASQNSEKTNFVFGTQNMEERLNIRSEKSWQKRYLHQSIVLFLAWEQARHLKESRYRY